MDSDGNVANRRFEFMVGTTGFEPATSRTPSVRATRLRYVPTALQPHYQRITRVRAGSRQRASSSRSASRILDGVRCAAAFTCATAALRLWGALHAAFRLPSLQSARDASARPRS